MDKLERVFQDLRAVVEDLKKPKNVTLLYSDHGDWAGVYVDGRLEAEGRRMDECLVLEALGITARSCWRGPRFFEEWGGECPPTDDVI